MSAGTQLELQRQRPQLQRLAVPRLHDIGETCKELRATSTNSSMLLYRARMVLRGSIDAGWFARTWRSSITHVMGLLTVTCKESSRLQSRALDRRLSIAEWLLLRVHTAMCGACTRVARQLSFLRLAARCFPGPDDPER